MKTVRYLLLFAAFAVSSVRADEEWRRVAFPGEAKVKSITGLVEVIAPESRILREGQMAKPGDVLRVWRGAELVLEMQASHSFVRAKGPALVRLAQPDGFNRTALTGAEEKVGFVVRSVWGHGRFTEDGVRWHDLQTGMVLSDGAKVRPFRDTTIDLYHNKTGAVLRLTDHSKSVALNSKLSSTGSDTMIAAKAP